MPRTSPWIGIITGLALVASPASSQDAPGATLVGARSGSTKQGAVRLVFQVDRSVEFLTVELLDGTGFEIHLLGVETPPDRAPLSVGGELVEKVTFRQGPSGTVARIQCNVEGLLARTFLLDDPSRVVVDVARETARQTKAPAPTEPPTERADFSLEPAAAVQKAPASPASEHDEGEPFDELLTWITGVKLDAQALQLSETEEDRVRYRRSLAFLLAKRGLVHEAERMLSGALASGGYDRATAFQDSLQLAELRIQTGNVDGAAEVAGTLSGSARTAPQRLRLARILSQCNFPDLARAHLEEALPRLTGRQRVESQLLLARAYWDRKDIEKAHAYVGKLTGSRHVPPDLSGPALILEGDCLWALGRAREAEKLYRAALAEMLEDEEASWVTLQLGNLAHRDGRVADAIDRYREARDRWPETFFGTQAEWFLRVAEQTERLQSASVVRNRG